MVKNAHFANAWPETATQKTLLDILPDIPTYPGMTGHVLNAHALRQFQHIPLQCLGITPPLVGKQNPGLPHGPAILTFQPGNIKDDLHRL